MKIKWSSLSRIGRAGGVAILLFGLAFTAEPADGASIPVKLNASLVVDDLVSFARELTPDGKRVIFMGAGPDELNNDLYSVPTAGGAVTKLNPPLVTRGGVFDFQISPDSTHVVYRADADTDGVIELYSVPAAGGVAVKLNSALPVNADVEAGYQISPDSSRVVYLADGDAFGVIELYSAPIAAAGGEVKLNSALPGGADVEAGFQVSADSSRVVYLADGDTLNVIELYSAPIAAAGGEVKLNSALPGGADVEAGYQISADSSRVVYLADGDTLNVIELYSAPIAAAGGEVKLNSAPPVGTFSITQFQISPDSSRVVYYADGDTDEVFELYSAPIAAAGGEVKLNSALPGGADVEFGFQISADSSRVVYRADADTLNVIELYSAPIAAAGGEVKLNSALPGGGDVSSGFQISADSSRVVYRADGDTDNVFELYSAPIAAAGGEVELNSALPAGSDVEVGFLISPDSSRVVYLADGDTPSVIELYSAPIAAAGGEVELNSALPGGGDVFSNFLISADSSRVVYRADGDTDNVVELYSAPIAAAGGEVKLNSSLLPGGILSDIEIAADSLRVVYTSSGGDDLNLELYSAPTTGGSEFEITGGVFGQGDVLSDFQISADSSRVVYRADGDIDGIFEVYSVPVDGGTTVKLNGPLVPGGSVGSFQISADSSRVVYRADGDTDGVFELYSVPAAGGAAVKLSSALPLGGDVFADFQISADSSRVVYLADSEADGLVELYSAPIAAAGGEVKLNSALPGGADVEGGFQISADSSRVVYRADGDTLNVIELYSAPIAAAGGEVRLNSPLPGGADVELGFQISADSSRVVYLADGDAFNDIELYSAPIGAAGGEVRLNAALTAGGDVISGFQISADSSRVVYRADGDTDGVFELYSVPAAGGAVLKLNSALPANADVEAGFQISPDSSRVIYLADGDMLNVIELYSAPIAAAGGEVELNSALPTGGDVFPGFQISADSSRVAYRADGDSDGDFELYSAPIVAAGGEVKLNPTLPGGGDVDFEFQISADSSRVVYRADGDTDGVFELYSAPIDTAEAAVKVSGPLVAGGNVHFSMKISADSARVVYFADGDTDAVDELYSVLQNTSVWAALSGDWDTATNWECDSLPTSDGGVLINRAAVVTIPPGAGIREVAKVHLGGGSGTSIIELQNGGGLEAEDGFTLSAGAVIRGDGTLSSGVIPFAIPSGAELSVAPGESLRVVSGALSNAGRVEVFGIPAVPAEIDFEGAVTNSASTGFIAAHDATLRFRSDIINDGTLSLSGGFNDILGDVDNSAEPGRIVVSGGASAVFYDDVTNSGSINASASGTVVSQITFLGSYSGNGVSGAGHVFLEGDSQPGFSPGEMSFGGSLSLGPFSNFEFEIGGTTPVTEYDRLVVAGDLGLGGTAQIVVINGFVPAVGDSFDLWDAGSVAGSFAAVNLPALPAGRYWHDGQFNSTGVLSVGSLPDTYAAYAALYGLTGGPGDDDDGDGLPNLVEYLLGLDPTAVEAAPGVLTLSQSGGDDILEFSMADPAGSDVLLDLRRSTDLVNWTAIASRAADGTWSGTASVNVTPGAPGMADIEISQPTGAGPRYFYTLFVTQVP